MGFSKELGFYVAPNEVAIFFLIAQHPAGAFVLKKNGLLGAMYFWKSSYFIYGGWALFLKSLTRICAVRKKSVYFKTILWLRWEALLTCNNYILLTKLYYYKWSFKYFVHTNCTFTAHKSQCFRSPPVKADLMPCPKTTWKWVNDRYASIQPL